MSKEPICTKKIIQPCITSLLLPSAELSEPQTGATEDIVEVPFESVKHKKRKHSKNSSDQHGNNSVKRSLKKNQTKCPSLPQLVTVNRRKQWK